ncbi:MAG: extracellular solute-binding protein [Chloroflexales bacterium]|nr:extracellular solute-binding protein [Chloroflexales bacterium]
MFSRQLGLLLLILIVLTSACAAAPAPDRVPATATVVTFGAPEDQRAVYQPFIDAFQQENPAIQVQFVAVAATAQLRPGASDQLAPTIDAIASAADTAVLQSPPPAALVSPTWQDLAPLLAADPGFDPGVYHPAAWSPGSGARRVLPLRLQVPLLRYHQELWVARGVSAPQPDWSWSDLFVATAQLAQQPAGDDPVAGLLNGPADQHAVTALLGDLAAEGVDFLAAEAAPPRLDQPAVAAALERTVQRVVAGALPAPVERYVDGSPVIRSGQAGLWPAEAEPADGPALAFPIGSVPFPAGAVPAPTLGSGLVMSRGTAQPEAAWRWLAFLSRQPVPARGATPLNSVPARADLLAGDASWLQRDPALQAALARPALDPAAQVTLAQVQAALETALRAVLADEQPVREALHAAQSNLEAAGVAVTDAATPSPLLLASPPPVAGAAAVTITFESTFSNLPERFPAAIERFHQDHPTIQTTFQFITGPSGGGTFRDVAERSDCFVSFGIPDPADQAAFLDLQPLLDADTTLPHQDFVPSLVEPLRRTGRLLGLPLAVRLPVLGYDQALFDAAGLAYPQANWTMDDFVRVTTSLTQEASDAQTYGFVYRTSETDILPWFLDHAGAYPTRGQDTTLQPNFTDPQVQMAIRSFLNIVKWTSPFEHVSAFWQEADWVQVDQVIAEGRAGMWWDMGDVGVWSLNPAQHRSATAALTIPPLGAHAPSIWGSQLISFYISAQTLAPDACWTLLKAMSADVLLVGQLGTPARVTVADSEAFEVQASPSSREIFRRYRTAFELPPAPANGGASLNAIPYLYWFEQALDRVLQGQDLEAELALAQDRTSAFLDCLRQGSDQATCARQVVPDDPGRLGTGSN